MKHALISTWKMSFDGLGLARGILAGGGALPDAIRAAVNDVENNPEYVSVGYGGLPNREGDVELDAAYMDGSTGLYGGVIGAKGIANPIDLAIHLSQKQLNCVLSGSGAERYARTHGFAFRNMLTEKSQKRWADEEVKSNDRRNISAYDGHDTVCVIGRQGEHMAAGVSTSGLFMKVPGRVGDSPIVGAGLYSDSAVGSASATGMGEDIVRGVLSYEVVRQIAAGKTAQEACHIALDTHTARMRAKGIEIGAISLIALSADGTFGGVTNLPEFAFVYADADTPPTIHIASCQNGVCTVAAADAARLEAYAND